MNLRWGGLLLVVGLSACTARLYPGPKRPDAEVATLETDGMTIVAVDDQRADPGVGPSRYEVLAGMHAVSVRLNDSHPVFSGSAAGGHRVSDNALAVCFRARGQHAYLLRPVYAGAAWRVEVIDENVTGAIVTKATSAVAPDCSPEAPRVMAPVVPPEEAAPPPAPSSSAVVPDGGVAASAPDAATPAIAEVPAPRPLETVRPATDSEVPRAARRRSPYVREVVPPPPPAHPGTGIGFEMGIAFGGDRLASVTLSDGQTDTLSAGDGLLFALVGDVTPLWFGDAVGVGFGASIGWKYADVGASNGSISLSRFPASAFIQLLPTISNRWFFQLRGGVTKTLGATLSGDGIASFSDVSFDSRPGAFAEVGVYRAFSGSAGMLFATRYTNEMFTVQGEQIDASSVGVSFGIYYSNQ
jgi:hypothetical protein